MSQSKLRIAVGVLAVVGLCVAVQALAQDGPPPGGPGGAGGPTSGPVVITPDGKEHRPQWNSEEMKKRIEDMRKKFSEDMRTQMEATPEEWKVLEPKIQKVMELSAQSRFGGGMRVRWRPMGEQGGEGEKATPVETARAELEKLLKAKDAKPEQVQKALTAYREAKEKAAKKSREELEKAQKELREVLTQKQEAFLVLRGILD